MSIPTIPSEVKKRFYESAREAVEQLRIIADEGSAAPKSVLMARMENVLTKVYVDDLADIFQAIAYEEFCRLKKAAGEHK